MSAPLYEKLKIHDKAEVYPFHMPGHKMGRGIAEENLFALDITEIVGFDNLHQPMGVIKEAQTLAAKTFGADETFFLVNGSSCGIIASILTTCSNKPVIVGRNSHKSVFDGIVLSGARPIYVMPKESGEYPIFGAVGVEDIETACKENPDAGAVIIVSPTYEGVVSDIKKISTVVHKYDMVLIVDEAHGAHFSFSGYFPESALKWGADIVVQSIHKTLPCPTQSSLLHVCSNRIDISRLKKCLSMTQSSSPSYILMAMIDKCREYLDNQGKRDFIDYVNNLKNLREKLSELKNFKLLDKDEILENDVFDYDRGKIVVFSSSINCLKIGNILRNEEKIELEMCCPTHFIAMTSVSDTKDGFERLAKALAKIDSRIELAQEDIKVGFIFPKPKISMIPKDAFNRKSKQTVLSDSVGAISAEFVIPYPPGIPLLSPGEEITEEILDIISNYKKCNANVIGTNDINLEKILILE